jgi:adenosylcobinamide-phosphate guanylyltransferase
MNGLVFVTSGDLPLLDEKIIQVITEKFNPKNVWTSFLVSKKFLNSLGLESNLLINSGDIDCVHTGISIINADKIQNLDPVKENYIILDDKRIAFNLNTKKDYELLSSS